MHTTLSNTQPAAAITHQFDPATVIIRISKLSVITGYARPTIYKRLKDDPTFPRPAPLSDSKSRGAPFGLGFGRSPSLGAPAHRPA